jgi:hypothetical protein
MKAGKIILFSILGLATVGLAYLGYRQLKKAIAKVQDKAIEDYLKNPTEEKKQELIDNDVDVPDINITSQSITWVANDTPPLKKGNFATADDSNIKKLQKKLSQNDDGFFGNDTETAVYKKLNKYIVSQADFDSIVSGTSTTNEKVDLSTTKFNVVTSLLINPELKIKANPSTTATAVKTVAYGIVAGIVFLDKWYKGSNDTWLKIFYLDSSAQARVGYVQKKTIDVKTLGKTFSEIAGSMLTSAQTAAMKQKIEDDIRAGY